MRRRRLLALAVATAVAALPLAAVTAAPASAAPGAVTFVHAVPGAPGFEVSVDGTVQVPSLVFGTVERRTVETGERTVTAAVPGTPGAFSRTLTVSPATSVVLQRGPVAPFDIVAYPDDLSPLAPGLARLTVRHAADLGPVDVSLVSAVGSIGVAAGLANGAQATTELPAGSYGLLTRSAADSSPIVPLSLPDLTLEAGVSYTVYAVGGPAPGDGDGPVIVLPGDPEPEPEDTFALVIDPREVGTATPTDPSTSPSTPATTAPTPTTGAGGGLLPGGTATTAPGSPTTPVIPTAVPAGDGTHSWTGPAGLAAAAALIGAAVLGLGAAVTVRRRSSHAA